MRVILFFVALLLCISGISQSRTKVIMLGTGTPNAEADRSGPAVAILVDGQPYVIDCGPGVVRSAVKAGILPKN